MELSIKPSVMVYVLGLLCLSLFSLTNASFPYYGTKIGSLKRLHHGVSGDVYAVDSRTIFVKKFNYDGEAPAAYFYVGSTPKPSNDGAYRLRDERGGTASLTRRYRNKDITLTLPEGVTLKDIKWFSVWCDEFAVNFGDVAITSSLDFPRPQKLSNLAGVHGVKSDPIVVVDAQTLLVPNFSYDGEAPDAKFWVGPGDRPTPNGLRIPDENGKENPLRRYDHKTIVLTLPDDLTIFDIGHFGVWCEAFTVDFGHIRVPKSLNVPPSLKMLGISPQSKLNCEVLYDDKAYEVRWAMAGDSIVVQLVAKLEDNQYMSFGISPDKDRSTMIGADVVVSWVEKDTGKGYAVDYYLSDKSQCSGKRGSCPDVNIEDNTNSIRLLNAAMVNGYSIVTYQRSLNATDKLDLPISRNGFEAIVWAIGPLNERKETSFHSQFSKNTHYIDFGRQPTWNCPTPEGTKPGPANEPDDLDEDDVEPEREKGYPPPTKPANSQLIPEEEFYDNNRAQALQSPNRRQEGGSQRLAQRRPVPTPKPVAKETGAWEIPPIECNEPEDGVFYAQMGPTGGKHGYSAITGHVGWGISWYINGLLIPEIHVVRGKTYTFVTEGGNNPDIPAKYHPFYITDDPVGGYEHKREEEKKNIRIFAGVQRSRSGQVTPTGVGRLCNWTPDADGPPADDYQSFGAYQRTLTLKCDPGEPGVITWKPDNNTPDTVYYHCFTHRYLGWKIHVHDTCDDAKYAASEKHSVRVAAPVRGDDELDAEESIRHESKVSPNDNFLLKHQTDLIKNHNMNGTPPKLSFEITKSTEITQLISDGIRAAEALENSILRQKQYPNTQATAGSGLNANNDHNQQGPPPNVDASINPSKIAPSTHATSSSSPSSGNLGPPLQPPFIPTAAPETLHGEIHLHDLFNSLHSFHSSSPSPPSAAGPPSPSPTPTSHNKPLLSPALLASHTHNNPHLQMHIHHTHTHIHNLTNNLPLPGSHKTISLSEFLRPPFNAPLFHPVKLPGRRPYPGPIKKVPASKPILPQQLPRHPAGILGNGPLPQPSVIVNHYRKPVPSILRPFMKDSPFPLQPLAASVLLLGQSSELNSHRKSSYQNSHRKKPVIPVPYADLTPQSSVHKHVLTKTPGDGGIKPLTPIKLPHPLPKETSKPLIASTANTTAAPPLLEGAFKNPFNAHEVEDEPSPEELANMKPAINEGFKPDTVVVESGFKPILRHDGPMPPPEVVEQMANRREDPNLEIDEAMESDILFLNAQAQQTQTQHFEPMFIPSPPDSTNATIIVRKSSGLQLQTKLHSGPSINKPLYNQPISSMLKSTMPEAAKLRNATLDDILSEDSSEDQDNEPMLTQLAIHNNETSLFDQIKPVYEEDVEADNNLNYKSSEYLESHEIEEPEKLSPKPLKLMPQSQLAMETSTTTLPTTTSSTSEKPLANKLKNYDRHSIDDVEMDGDSEEFNGDEDELFAMEERLESEPEAQAAERVDTYYLPPDNRKVPDASAPSGSVIAYDGKSVIDSSLVLPPKLDSDRDATDDSNGSPRFFGGSNTHSLSKIEQLIRNTPQFVPFRGEIPPLSPNISPVSTQRSISTNKPTYYSPPQAVRGSSTKLQIIANNRKS